MGVIDGVGVEDVCGGGVGVAVAVVAGDGVADGSGVSVTVGVAVVGGERSMSN